MSVKFREGKGPFPDGHPSIYGKLGIRMQSITSTSRRKCRALRRLTTALCCCLFAATVAVAAAQSKSGDGDSSAENRRIRITADQLTTNSAESFAEFTGNVEAVQADFTIRADSLRIYYRRKEEKPEPEAVAQDSIQRIVANGNVRINTGEQSAKSDRAEYSVEDGRLTLIGKGSTITDGLNSIEGSRLTLNRFTGEITVDGGEQRVRAVFYPNSDLGFSAPAAPSNQKKDAPQKPAP